VICTSRARVLTVTARQVDDFIITGAMVQYERVSPRPQSEFERFSTRLDRECEFRKARDVNASLNDYSERLFCEHHRK
jgi:hypothetical protein